MNNVTKIALVAVACMGGSINAVESITLINKTDSPVHNLRVHFKVVGKRNGGREQVTGLVTQKEKLLEPGKSATFDVKDARTHKHNLLKWFFPDPNDIEKIYVSHITMGRGIFWESIKHLPKKVDTFVITLGNTDNYILKTEEEYNYRKK